MNSYTFYSKLASSSTIVKLRTTDKNIKVNIWVQHIVMLTGKLGNLGCSIAYFSSTARGFLISSPSLSDEDLVGLFSGDDSDFLALFLYFFFFDFCSVVLDLVT